MPAINPFDPNKEASAGPVETPVSKGKSDGISRGSAFVGGFENPVNQAEFLPVRVRHNRIRRKRLMRQGYLLVVCVAAVCVLSYARAERVARARGDLATLEKSRTDLRKQAEMVKPLERQMSDLLVRKRIDEELGSRTDCIVVLAELCRITPPGIVMVSLDLQTVELISGAADYPGRNSTSSGKTYRGKRPVAAADRTDAANDSTGAVRRSRLTITGVAVNDVDVANFIGQLSASRLFDGVNMGYTKTVVFRGSQAREFQASCYLAW